ncbi:MAG: PriCT-2 domain-containing protein, partial [Deltaproteobacteria bacterium]|nr:PriCT-2 domain-containing protein [Deltaproteobacteria bacterium]
MRVNFKAKHGTPLVDAGYMLVPIAAGKKFPTTKGWPKLRATVEDVKKWARTRYYGGLGVLGEFNPGIDIDVQHEETAELLVRWCMKNIGTAPVRIGNWPRVLIPCSAPEGGIGPDNSNKYEDDLECTHQVEIKATGQQWVAYGTHPGTGKAYTWKGGELHENMADLLPTLTGEKITALFKYFEQIRPQEWTVKQLGRERRNEGGVDKTGELSGNQAFENYTPPLNITTDKLRSMLDLINPDEGHEVWLRTGMALYHQYKGSDEGLDLFSEWSEKSSEYDLEEIKTRWPTWEAKTYSRAPVTAATIVKTYNDRAKKSVDPTRRPKSNYLSYWERRYGLIELTDGSEVHDMGVPLYKSARRTMKAFAEHNAAYTHKTVAPDGEVKI